MLKLAALFVASAAIAGATAATATASTTTSSTDTLVSSAPWWEKVTVTLGGDGKPQSCLYQSSLKSGGGEDCDIASTQAALATSSDSSSKGEITRITFERRFTPGAAPPKPDLQTGDTLLGGQVMALAIDPRGSVKGCKVVATSGAMQPQYSCDDAQAERFQASVGGAQQKTERDGYMTILVYGHAEHMV